MHQNIVAAIYISSPEFLTGPFFFWGPYLCMGAYKHHGQNRCLYAQSILPHAGNKGRCYEAKIEESEKTGHELNPGHLWLEPPVFCHLATTARCATEAFSTTCAVHIEDCEGWWLSSCCGSVEEHWRLKPKVSWVGLPVTAGLFTFLHSRLITSNFLSRCLYLWVLILYVYILS